MTKARMAAFLISSVALAGAAGGASAASDGGGDWRQFSREANGDVHYFDASRVKRTDRVRQVWSRIRYKTSVMGASSYQSLLELDCAERTVRILQNTFFSDRRWERPAMNTDKTAKPKRSIPTGSAAERLAATLCDQ
ncbi:MAG: surface-adhesin E family protein [Pseudomonadota bacterium]